MSLTEIVWPEAIKARGGLYPTPDGDFPRVTTINKTLGLGVEGLIKWSANLERAATLEAAGEVLTLGADPGDPAAFLRAVESRLGSARQHQKALQKGGDIGTEVHGAIEAHIRAQMTGSKAAHTALSQPAAVAFMSWRAWWDRARLKPVRVEQTVWDPEWKYAGTIDLIAEALPGCEYAPEGTLVAPDWKSSNGVYESYHLQLASYVRAARRWAPGLMPGPIVRTPKDASKGLDVQVVPLGHMYDGRILSLEELLVCFKACRDLHRLLVEKEEDK